MAQLGKGLKAIAKQQFEDKVHRIVVMGDKEKARTLVVTRKRVPLDAKRTEWGEVEAVEGIPLTVILQKAQERRYDARTEFGTDGKVSKLYLMKPQKA